MEMNFCRRCGKPLTHVQNHVYKCPSGHTLFANANPAIGVFFVTPDDQVLMSERGIEPHKGMLDTFGGFLDGKERFEDAVTRELQEELGLKPADYEPPHYLCSAVADYPYQGEMIPYASVFFWTRLTTDRELAPADDVAAIRSIPLNQTDLTLLHDDAIRESFQRLQELFNKPEQKEQS